MAHPLAGQPAPSETWIDPDALIAAYYNEVPNPERASERVAFGTSGHRGSPFTRGFNEAHVLAVAQAIWEYRKKAGTTGPIYLGKDTHGVSESAERTVMEVLAANGAELFMQAEHGITPTPVISRAILNYNRARSGGLADGIVITPSHNPPEDGGIKYNPPHGGPADAEVTQWIEERANTLLAGGARNVKRIGYREALKASTTHHLDFISDYVDELDSILEMQAIRSARIRIGVDPLGGASLPYWSRIAERWGLELTIVNPQIDPRFSFMTLDHDGKIRMDCSSAYAMAKLVALRDQYDVSFGNDPDSDRHGIVVPSKGLLNPNHFLAVAIDYLLEHRPSWRSDLQVGKTLVTSGLIDRVARRRHRQIFEVPVGFKWFVDGLLSGSLAFAGEESAGASFLRKDGRVWTTDKDGIVLCLLAAEILAVTEQEPGVYHDRLTQELGRSYYARLDAPASAQEKSRLKRLSPSAVGARVLAGSPILARMTEAPAGGSIGGLKVTAENGWFAARPSGTENAYKIYAESFESPEHLQRILDEARAIVATALCDTNG